MSLVQSIVEKVENSPPDKQQEVLKFVELLQSKIDPETTPPQEDETTESVLTKAAQFMDSVEGAVDLSTNKNYLEGYGR